MDADTLKLLFQIALFGGLFFVMMRFGCGAHMMRGHGRNDHSGAGDSADGQVKDPVCGMTVDRERSSSTSRYRGSTYYFCSNSCRDKFEQEPEKYAAPGDHPAHRSGAHGCH